VSRKGGGLRPWWLQRITAVALVPLSLWFVFSLLGLPSLGQSTVVNWIAVTWNAVPLGLFVAAVAWHSKLGVEVVIEDYIHGSAKHAVLLCSTIAHVIVGAAGLFAIVKIIARTSG